MQNRRLRLFISSAQGPCVDIPPPASVICPLSCIECCADKILRVLPHAVWNRSCFPNWYDLQLSQNRFHWEHVKHQVIKPVFINDAGTWWLFVILPQHSHERTVVGLNYKSFNSFYWIDPMKFQNLISIQVCSCNRKS